MLRSSVGLRLLVILVLARARQVQQEDDTLAFAETAGTCAYFYKVLIKASEQTCFDDLPRDLCCRKVTSVGCFPEKGAKEECCKEEGLWRPESLNLDMIIPMVIYHGHMLQNACPLAGALGCLLPYLTADTSLTLKHALANEIPSFVKTLHFVGADWALLLQSRWPVFGILRRIRDRRATLEAPKASYLEVLTAAEQEGSMPSPVLALENLNVSSSDCMTGSAARLHLALLADHSSGQGNTLSPALQLAAEAERLAARCHRTLYSRLRALLESPVPVLGLLHRLWQKLRKKGLLDLFGRAKSQPLAALTRNGCRCQPSWKEGGFACGPETLGCCDPGNTGNTWCRTQPGCAQAIDTCFPKKPAVGGPGIKQLSIDMQEFLHFRRDAAGYSRTCEQVTAMARLMPRGSQVLDVGAGTAPCKKGLVEAGLHYTAQDAKAYSVHDRDSKYDIGAGSVYDKGYGEIDVVSDITSIPLPSDSFDLVVCTDVLEHVLQPKEAIREISRLLKPGGLAVLQVPFGGALHNLPHHYYAGFTHRWIEDIALQAGMDASWGYHFESMAKRLQRSLRSQECLHVQFGGKLTELYQQLVIDDLPPVLEHLRACSSNQEAAQNHAFPTGIRAVLMKRVNWSSQIPAPAPTP